MINSLHDLHDDLPWENSPNHELVPLAAQIRCIEREIGYRERVYPKWIERGRMTLVKSLTELAAMRAVLKTLREIESKERLL